MQSAQSTLLRGWVPAFAASIPIIIIPITVLSIQLAAAQSLHLSPPQTASWIVTVYGLPGLISLVFATRYRQPLIVTGNVFALIFFASLGGQLSYPELVGASIVAGGVVLLVALFDLTDHLAAWIPAPIVLGLLAGAIMPYVAGVFTAMRDEPLIVGGTFAAFLLSRLWLRVRVPAIFPALVVGLALAMLTGRTGQTPTDLSLSALMLTIPSFSLPAIATVTPILVVLIVAQSNLPSVIYLRSQGYRPPERMIDGVGGIATAIGSLWGPTAVSLALPLVSLAAAPDAGELETRHRSAYLLAVALILIALLAGVAAMLPMIIPAAFLLALAGLALEPVLASSLQAITRGPLLLGPLFAFAIALSKFTFLGFGPFFWSLVFGMLISLLLERDALKAQRAAPKAALDSAKAVAERWVLAMDHHDLEAAVACFAPEYHDEAPARLGESVHGQDEVRQNFAALFKDIPNLRAELRGAVAGGDIVWMEWRMYGTRTNGTPFEFVGINLLGVKDGRFSWGRIYTEQVRDAGSIAEQIQ